MHHSIVVSYYRSTRSVDFDAFLLLAVAILSRLISDFFLGYLSMLFTVPFTYLVCLALNKYSEFL